MNKKLIHKLFSCLTLMFTMMITGIGCKNASINVKPPPQIIESIRRDAIEVEQSATIQKVDILVVIDTSSSMNHHQQKLGAKFG